MKILLIIASWCLLACWSWSQNTDTLNRSDENGKQGHWIYYGKDRPDSGIPPEGKVEEGNYVNGHKHGAWITYHTDGSTPKRVTEYDKNRPIGVFKTYYPNGALKEKGRMHLNNYRDSLMRYYQDGQLQFAAWFDSIGKEHGLVQYWLQDGTSELEYVSAHGMIIPSSVKKVNQPQPEVNYDVRQDGPERAPRVGEKPRTHRIKWNPDGQNTVYNFDDKVWQEGEFKDGRLWNGKVYVYDREGTLLRIKVVKNGEYHSDEQL